MNLENWSIEDAASPTCIRCADVTIDLHNAFALTSLVYSPKAREARLVWQKDYELSGQPERVELVFVDLVELLVWPSVNDVQYESETVDMMIVAAVRADAARTHPWERRLPVREIANASLTFVMMDGAAIELAAGASRCVVGPAESR